MNQKDSVPKSELTSQELLRLLWDTQGPHEVVALMATEKQARSLDCLLSIEAQCEEVRPYNTSAHERMVKIRDTMRAAHTAVKNFQKACDLGTLADFIAHCRLYWMSDFARLIEESAQDALCGGEATLQTNLISALGVRNQAHRLLGLLDSLHQNLSNGLGYLEQEPDLVSDGFIRYLELSARQYRRNSQLQKADHLAKVLEGLQHLRRCLDTQKELIEPSQDSPPSHRLFRAPLTADQSNTWFVGSPQFRNVLNPLIQAILQDQLSIREAVISLWDLKWAQTEEADSLNALFLELEQNRVQAKIWAAEVVYFLLAGTAPEQIAEAALKEFEQFLDNPIFNGRPRVAWETAVLRLGESVLLSWLRLNSGIAWLQKLKLLLDRALEPSPERGPRLERDLYFKRAMTIENLALGSPEMLRQAAADYKRGLAVAKVRHEAEARAQALMNLANVYRQMPPDQMPSDGRVLGLYQEALALLNSDVDGISGADILGNLAIHYNERTCGDRAENQEIALAYIDRAIKAYSTLEEGELSSPIYMPTLAQLEMVKGNIVRARSYSDPIRRLDIAVDCYHSALRRLGCDEYSVRRGIIRLNLAQAERDKNILLEGEPNLPWDRVLRNYDEAIDLLKGEGLLEHQAMAEREMLRVELAAGSKTQALKTAIREIEHIYDFQQSIGAKRELQKTHFKLASLYDELSVLEMSADETHSNLLAEKALESYDQLADIAACRGAYEEAIDALVAACDLLTVHKGRLSPLVDSITTRIEKAIVLGEKLKQGSMRLETELIRSALIGPVYSRLLWLRSAEGTASEAELFELSSHAKAGSMAEYRFTSLHDDQTVPQWLRHYYRELKSELRQIEALRWDQQAKATPEKSLFDDISAAATLRKDVENKISSTALGLYDFPGESVTAKHAIAQFVNAYPDRWILDITVSAWGTIILLREPGASGTTHVKRLPVSEADIDGWLFPRGDGPEAPKAWIAAYTAYSQGTSSYTDRRRDFEEATRLLCERLSREVLSPALQDVLGKIKAHRMVISAGTLTALPLHAAEVAGEPLHSLLMGLSYTQNAKLLPHDDHEPLGAKRALCLMCDTDNPPTLLASPGEILDVGELLLQHGTDVTIAASFGGKAGTAAFLACGLTPDPKLRIHEKHPTPDWMESMFEECDHIVFAGHGTAVGPKGPALHLADAFGGPSAFSLLETVGLKTLQRRPLFVLSACDTAHEVSGLPVEPGSLVAWLLRSGARGVVGASWRVIDASAAAFNRGFHGEYALGHPPDVAYCRALTMLARQESHLFKSAAFGFWESS